jgi:diketogulonate reductase-like aldo/keto reductase
MAETAVAEAIRAGYVHIDTAAAYENEEFVGAGIKRSGIKRDELFLTTKLWNNVRGYDETIAACEDSLKKLGTDYVDLYLIHWPNPLKFRSCWKEKNAETWRAFEQLYKDGKVRAIGVSNFCRRHLDALFETAELLPSVNQIRLCPGDVDDDTVSYSRSKGILLEAYSPLGCGKAFDSEAIKEIAAKYGRSVSQICLNWSLRNGFLPLAKSVSPQHIAENADIFDFELETADVIRLNEMEGECGMHSNPDEKPF